MSGFTLPNLPSGKYHVHVEAPDCDPYDTDIEVNPGLVVSVHPVLHIQDATLTVEVPVVSASIWIDGVYKGQAGLKIVTTPGLHVVKVKTEKATTVVDAVQTLTGKNSDIPLGLLDVTSANGPYEVLIAEHKHPMVSMGTSPLKIPVEAGDWTVRLLKPGYPPVEAKYTVMPGDVVTVDKAVACAMTQLTYSAPREFNVHTFTWYVDHAPVFKDFTGVLPLPTGHHVIGFIASGDGYNWQIKDSNGSVANSGSLGQRIAAEFEVNLSNGNTVIEARSWASEKGIPIITIFNKMAAQLEVTVNGGKVKTRNW